MTPEQVLSALVTHSQSLHMGTPDPLVMAVREEKIGKKRPLNWSLLRRGDDREYIEIWPSVRSAQGRDSGRISRFSIAEVAAYALVGMPDRNWQALQCAIGVGDNARGAIFARVHTKAIRSREDDQFWPAKVRRRRCACGRAPAQDYLLDIVELSIRQLEDPVVYNTNHARADWFGMSERNWYGVMRRPYDAVSAHLWFWYHAGIGHIQNRVSHHAKSCVLQSISL